MISHDANSCDLDTARTLSQRLAGETVGMEPSESIAGEGFTRFTLAQINRPAQDEPRDLPERSDSPEPPVSREPQAAVPARSPSVDLTPIPWEPPPPKPVPFVPTTFGDWDLLVLWCLDFTQGRSTFVVDTQGFILAHCGSWAFDEVEAVGTQLQATSERANQIHEGDSTRTLTLQFDEYWVTGLNFAQDDGGYFTVGVVGSQPLTQPQHRTIDQQVWHNLEHL